VVNVSESVAPEFVRYVARRRAEGVLAPERPRDTGQFGDDIRLDPRSAVELMRVAALRSAGIFRPTKRTTIAWVDGSNELAVVVAELDLVLGDGQVVVVVPVRCDQVRGEVRVTFAVGSPDRPRGLYAATERLPRGPQLVVDTWGEALVAFAWQCLLALVSGMAAATGKDTRGNYLVPVEIAANSDGLVVVPMGRHRFSGSTGLTTGAGR
jgi:hypothetical protein